ncbi:uncharacterized protein LOC123398687 isoform X3 [Hordeum vulgare subsp. vulgare]|uniref:uncharacterized protein LOC123398687 isoform X3 n=1 Tax=Hordeum vulgare subsp. vulgare TaxID=112509 RepID=UPI00162F1242|nr:uncharacterized protein LOC123398687 isoform X3 [Hordeum vulgare subsp. vulgare]
MTPGFGPGPQGSCDGVVRGPGLLLVKGGIACARRRRSKRRSRRRPLVCAWVFNLPVWYRSSSNHRCQEAPAITRSLLLHRLCIMALHS